MSFRQENNSRNNTGNVNIGKAYSDNMRAERINDRMLPDLTPRIQIVDGRIIRIIPFIQHRNYKPGYVPFNLDGMVITETVLLNLINLHTFMLAFTK